jgi:hypothetical protein
MCRSLCRNDEDCSSEESCQEKICREKIAACAEHEDCQKLNKTNSYCEQKRCVQCTKDADCRKSCIQNFCFTPCSDEKECHGNQGCCKNDGLCQENTCSRGCQKDGDCLYDEVCIEKMCVRLIDAPVRADASAIPADVQAAPDLGSGANSDAALSSAPAPTIIQCKGYRLPTEAEWEYAYRAGGDEPFYQGASESCQGPDPVAGKIGWYSANASKKTHPVGLLRPNAWGFFDLAGNVKEWCQDLYRYDLGSQSRVNPLYNEDLGDNAPRTVRGGSWADGPGALRGASRGSRQPIEREATTGFRCVRTLTP